MAESEHTTGGRGGGGGGQARGEGRVQWESGCGQGGGRTRDRGRGRLGVVGGGGGGVVMVLVEGGAVGGEGGNATSQHQNQCTEGPRGDQDQETALIQSRSTYKVTLLINPIDSDELEDGQNCSAATK